MGFLGLKYTLCRYAICYKKIVYQVGVNISHSIYRNRISLQLPILYLKRAIGIIQCQRLMAENLSIAFEGQYLFK